MFIVIAKDALKHTCNHELPAFAILVRNGFDSNVEWFVGIDDALLG